MNSPDPRLQPLPTPELNLPLRLRVVQTVQLRAHSCLVGSHKYHHVHPYELLKLVRRLNMEVIVPDHGDVLELEETGAMKPNLPWGSTARHRNQSKRGGCQFGNLLHFHSQRSGGEK